MSSVSSLRRTLKVLLISNDASEAHLFQESFRSLNVQLQVARDGAEALAALKPGKNRPVLVLISVTSINARLEMLQTMRSKAKLRRIPVIVLGTSRNKKEICRMYELGANAYLCKTADNFFDLIGDIERFWLRRVELPDWS